jgi:hypothetical protein
MIRSISAIMAQVPHKNIVVIGAGGLRSSWLKRLVHNVPPQVLSVYPQRSGSKKKEVM